MSGLGLALPILPGKEKLIDSYDWRAQIGEYTKSRERAGITLERVWIQRNPPGWEGQAGQYMMNLYVETESSSGSGAALKVFHSGSEFDKRFLELSREITGLEFAPGALGVTRKNVASWSDGSKQRYPGLMFTTPFQRGKRDAKGFRTEMYEKRSSELAASRKAMGLSREEVFVEHTPAWAGGDLLTVYVEGPQLRPNALRTATSAFDGQFKSGLKALLPSFVDIQNPAPPLEIEQKWDWQSGQKH